MLSMESMLNCGYLDDVSFDGPTYSVACDLAKMVEIEAKNCSKRDLVTNVDFSVSDPFLQSFSSVPVKNISLLGAPLSMPVS